MKAKGTILLLITALLWGLAFVAQSTAADHIGPFTFNASRNYIGALFLCGVIAVRKRNGHDRAPGEAGSGYSRKTLIIAGVACGIALFAASYLQQAGITSYPVDAAASGRSAFVTATYMVMVAVAGIFMGKRSHPLVFVAVVVAMLGMYLLCVPDGFGSILFGDGLVLLSAVGYAVHIFIIDRFTAVDGVRLSQVQLLVSGTLALLGALIFEHPNIGVVIAALVPILYAGICSDGIAYTLQIIGVQICDTTVATIIMSLESVFAGLGGWIILSESLTPIELLGCVLVFAAVLLSQVPELINKPQSDGQIRP